MKVRVRMDAVIEQTVKISKKEYKRLQKGQGEKFWGTITEIDERAQKKITKKIAKSKLQYAFTNDMTLIAKEGETLFSI